MRKHVIAKFELPGTEDYWQVDIEEQDEDVFIVTFEEYENVERKICTEKILSKDDLKGFAELINHIIGED